MADPRDPGFARLFVESRDALGRYVRRLVKTRGAAEDIVQEAFLRTYTHGEPSEPLRPYLFSIARNLASKEHRHARVVDASSNQDLSITELHGTCESAEDAALADERMRLLNEAVQSLPPQCRAAFTLRMFQDRSYKEIAAQLRISAKTVEKHIALGTTRVHAALAKRYQTQCDKEITTP
jgi:RNA polymerase sigma-70 factor (ECF subfamily)